VTDRDAATRVWDAVCRHIDGITIGSTVAALWQHGALSVLAGAERTRFGDLREKLNANAGHLHVAMRLLAGQGWVSCDGEPGTDELMIAPTRAGRLAMTEYAGSYPAAVRFLDDPDGALGGYAALMREQWRLPAGPVLPPRSDDVRRQVLAHLDGHVMTPVMSALSRGARPREAAAEILALRGWAHPDGRLTADGEIAGALARQYRYPMVYLPLLRRVPELIFADPAQTGACAGETHLDRELDIGFSGEVFSALCRDPFLDMALPLFDRQPVREQPAFVADMGCGDGLVLQTFYSAVCGRTRRGRHLTEYPLLMVGADPSPVARRVAAARLSAAGIPHLILDGDIADPRGFERSLAGRGLDARNALHICKSAIHDRGYRPPGRDEDADAMGTPPYSSAAFALPDGSAIPSRALAADLARLFRSWRPLAGRHGWLVIEAHAVAASQAPGLIGRTLVTALDATHGYSCQYPVEPEVFAWAARAAGFRSRDHREPAAAALGHVALTIDHFVSDG
jgi:hypothetical protein